jgi:hypothetical protein
LVRRQWDQLSDPVLRPFVSLFFEVLAYAIHGRPGTDGFLEQLTAPWLELGADVSDRLGIDARHDELLLGVAVVRGLLIEVLATGDVARPRAALERFLEMWERARTTAV